MVDELSVEVSKAVKGEVNGSSPGTKKPSPRRHSVAPHDISYHPRRFLLYSPPQQRQRWGEMQVLPRVNWGDLFFDLFYVAATYNVSNILVDSPTSEGLLYALATFWPVMGIWLDKVSYDARFVHEDDLVHRLFELAKLLIVATIVVHIRPVSTMSNISEQISMFVFSLMLAIGRVLCMLRYLEIHFFGIGQESLKRLTGYFMRPHLISLSAYIAAAVVSGVAYYGHQGGRRLADVTEPSAAYDYGTASHATTSNVPIWLCLAGYLGDVAFFVSSIVLCFPRDGSHKEISVPLNVDFMIHRNGEWIMLMLGESIFSILIVVPFSSGPFRTTFYCAVLSVILLQFLHFQSQPRHADGHALRRHKDAGVGWLVAQHVYSFALVSLGAAFTFFLTDHTLAGGRRLDERWLASSGSSTHDPEYYREAAAVMFSISLAIVFLSLDTLTLFHLGFRESQDRCVCKRTKRKNVKGLFLVALRLGLVAFAATLFLWDQAPEDLTAIGLALVVVQLLLRRLGGKYLSHAQAAALEHKLSSHQELSGENLSDRDTGEAQWPNVTHARADAQD